MPAGTQLLPVNGQLAASKNTSVSAAVWWGSKCLCGLLKWRIFGEGICHSQCCSSACLVE